MARPRTDQECKITEYTNSKLVRIRGYNRFRRYLDLLRRFQAGKIDSKYSPDEVIDLGSAGDFNDSQEFLPTELISNGINAREVVDDQRVYPRSTAEPCLENAIKEFFAEKVGLKLEDNQLLLGPGASSMLFFACQALSSKRRRILVPEVCINFAKDIPQIYPEVDVMLYPLDKGWKPKWDTLAQLTEDSKSIKFLYINYPLNPVGVNLSKKEYECIISLVRERKIIVWADQHMLFSNHKVESNILTISHVAGENRDLIIQTHTFSKELGMPGLRMSVSIGDPVLLEILKMSLAETLSMHSISQQKLASQMLEIFESKECRKVLKKRMKILYQGLKDLGFCVTMPDSGLMLLLPIPKRFRNVVGNIDPSFLFFYIILKETGVSVTPGSILGRRLEHMVRLSITRGETWIKKALQRLKVSSVRPDMEIGGSLIDEFRKEMEKTERNS